ncbi:FecR family protein [Arcticibacter sp. MXS-1]|uniref:FecR family protein n=1 Tax=Arcticibacter sp. MXS-1 TaxID=3341726 RepID=UPI0035A88970
MDTNRIKQLLRKYQEGTCSEEELSLINAWLNEEQDDDIPLPPGEIDKRLAEVKAQIDARIGGGGRKFKPFWPIAAIFLLFGASVAFFVFKSRPINDNGVKVVQVERKNGWVSVKTPRAMRYTLRLPDGSRVVLNASSSLRYPALFTTTSRPVHLDEGEAYFSVAHDKERPFTVYTPRFTTTALGTAFNVRAYAREHRVSVALLRGKVRVVDLKEGKSQKPRILLPHDQLVADVVTGKVTNKVFRDEIAVAGWSKGYLSFDNASADEVITAIENRFDVVIINKSRSKDWRYTGTFKEETLTEILETICLTEGVNYQMLTKDSIQFN